MNVKITKEEHERLCRSQFIEYTFGSRLFKTHTTDSDLDLMRVYDYNTVFSHGDYHMPNIHSFQYDDVENKTQYLWLTQRQFWQNLYSGDGTMQSDVVLFSGKWDEAEALLLCRTFKVIKAYCGVAKRDLKLHKDPKKIFHAHRSLYIAKKLIEREMPCIEDIQDIKENPFEPETLQLMEKDFRAQAARLYESHGLHNYTIPVTIDSLLNKMLEANNIREFRY
jgi:hypothetical protein